jgi:glutathione reductase (NADPH)
VDIYKTSFRPMLHTLTKRETKIFMKLVVDAATQRILGAHVMGEAAGEMIQLLGIALKMKATKQDFDNTMAVHPSAAEEWVTMRTPSGHFKKQP